MKKSISALLLLLLLLLPTLTSCGGGSDDTPPNMALLSDRDADRMLLYVPEQYTLFRDETTGVMLATLSKLDPTSISGYEVYPEEATVAEYVAAHFDPSELGDGAVLEQGYPMMQTVANNPECPTYVYSFKRGETDYRAMQVYVPRDSADLSKGVVILTYTARMTESVTGLVAYTKHIEDFRKTLQVFAFAEASGETAAPSVTPSVIDGMLLASDAKIVGYSLYVPESFKLDLSIGVTSAYDPDDRTSVTAAYYYPDSIRSVAEYVNEQLEAYAGFFDSCRLLGASGEGDVNSDFVKLTVDGFPAYRYEFEGVLDGTVYRFTQVYVLRNKGLTDQGVYTVTMTSPGADSADAEATRASHEADLESILAHFTFD